MKQLLALSAICLPVYLFAQGFGSFSHDQPYLAKDRTASGSFDWQTPFMDYRVNVGVAAVSLTNGAPVTAWTNQGSWAHTSILGPPYWTSEYMISTNLAFTRSLTTETLNQPMVLMSVMRSIRDGGSGGGFLLADFNGSGVSMGPPNLAAGKVDVFCGAHMLSPVMYANGVSNFFLLTIIMNGGSSSIRSNGVEIKTGNIGAGRIGDGGSGGFAIGSAPINPQSYGNYDFQRFLLWTNTLTTQFLTNAENQLISDFHIIGL
jgi:hypothetical protein